MPRWTCWYPDWGGIERKENNPQTVNISMYRTAAKLSTFLFRGCTLLNRF